LDGGTGAAVVAAVVFLLLLRVPVWGLVCCCCRSLVAVWACGGGSGQSVNTTDSAVRLTHIPTGIVVTCQNEKSQLQNKVSAMRVLQAKLLERKRLEERAELDALKSDSGSSWGNQMRSYVLHPYQMVKDLRTDYEVGNPAAVLDGDIDGFLEAGIRWRNRRDDE
jgi:peptide chain release factor 2